MPIIFHITHNSDWKQAQEKGFYEAPSLREEGFIHCSQAGQVAGVLQRYYKGKTDLVRLSVDTDKLTMPLKYELAPSVNEEFPHIYGPINLEAVVEVVPVSN